MRFLQHFPIWLLFFCLIHEVAAQLTIHITSIPANTPDGDDIYIAGNFNNWNPGDAVYQLVADGQGGYSITFSPSPGALEFKFTRGSWDTVEGSSEGTYIPNRTYTYNGSATNINLTIAGWEGGANHTATENVQILEEDYFMPQLNRSRRIWIYLPPDYSTTSKHYPVLYMQDGQNLFDAYYSFAGEWKIDESMNDLFAHGDYGAIVVGIDNGQDHRFDEYCPWLNPTYGGGEGDAYVSFLINTLKPHIDSTFRTLPGKDYTAIGGSSMGGLIAMYAAAAYPEVFSKAGVFSPAFWVADSIYTFVQSKTFHDQIRVYFVAGQNESAEMVPDMEQMDALLHQRGIQESNLSILVEPDGAHSEWFWAREYPDAYKWLFQNLVLSTSGPDQKKIKVYPNPSIDYLFVDKSLRNQAYRIYNISGAPMQSGTTQSNGINISPLPAGMYILEITEQGIPSSRSRFIKY